MKKFYTTLFIIFLSVANAFAQSDFTINDNRTVNAGDSFTVNNLTLERGGNLEVNGTLIINGDLDFNGPDFTWLFRPPGSLTVNAGGEVIVRGNLNNTNGNINLNGGNLTVEGNYNTEEDNYITVLSILSGNNPVTGNNTSVNASNGSTFEVQGTTSLLDEARINGAGNSTINLQDVLLSDPDTQLSASDSSVINVGGQVDGSGTLNTAGNGTINVEGAVGVDIDQDGNGISLLDFIVRSGNVRSIQNNFIYGNIIIEQNGTLNIPSNGDLLLLGDLTNNGMVEPNGGTVRFLGERNQTLSGNGVTRLDRVEVLGQLNLQSTLEVSERIAITGTLQSNGNLKLLSDATGTAALEMADQAQLTGNIIMQRYLPGGRYGHYIASPLNNVSVNTVTSETAYGWNANRQRWFRANSTGNFSSGMGYNVGINQETVLEFTGEPQMDPVTVTLTDINESDSVRGGFNLIGNPYPNAIRWDDRVISNMGLVEGPLTAYVFNGSETRYETLMAGDTIEAGQAFFVKALQNNVTLTFTPDMMITESPAVNTTRQFYRTAPTRTFEQVSLTLSRKDTAAENLQSRVRFVLDEEASLDYLPEEDAKYMAGFTNTTEINALVGNEKVAINVIPAPKETDTLSIPLQVKLIESGDYTLTLTGEKAAKFELLDNNTGTTHNLKSGYTFSGEAGENTNRFSLVVNYLDEAAVDTTSVQDTTGIQDSVVVQDSVLTKDELGFENFNELSEEERKAFITAEFGEEAYEEYLMLTADTLPVADSTGVPADTLVTNDEKDTLAADALTADTVAMENDTLPADTLTTAENVQTEQPTDSLVTTDSLDASATDSVAVEEAVTDPVTTTTQPDTVTNEGVAADTVQANVVSADPSAEGSAPAKDHEAPDRAEENGHTRKPGQSLGVFSPEKIRTAGFDGVIRIWFPKPRELNTRVVVFTLNGRRVTEQTIGRTDYSEVPVNQSGLYIIQLFSENKVLKRRVLVK